MAIDTYPVGLLLFPGCIAAALGGLALARRSLHRHELEKIQDVASYLYAVVGTLYAVILGLIVVDSMTKFSEARLTAEAEANALADIALFASRLPGDGPHRVRELAEAYIRSVTDVEWPLMQQGRGSDETRRLAMSLSRTLLAFEPANEREAAIFGAQVEAATQFWNSRRTRMVIASQRGLPLLEWVVLIAGGVITVVFTYLFKLDDFRLQLAITALLAVVIALNLYLILMFASPFSGDVKINPDGFALTRITLQEMLED
ncbi:bestrophin-like domain [Paludisphaera soli]|uniref:bestrophin-like domain n=1 Tax=Paludisphaera soli TaxID=2712865 RepID=UPI0013EC75B3|nr:DUF4239 domain-containing protein [Paludisphaera soli]